MITNMKYITNSTRATVYRIAATRANGLLYMKNASALKITASAVITTCGYTITVAIPVPICSAESAVALTFMFPQ